MLQQAKTTGDTVLRPMADTGAVNGDDPGVSRVDRIALATAFSVAVLIVGIVGLTCKSAKQPLPPAAVVAMSSFTGMPASALERHMSKTQRKN